MRPMTVKIVNNNIIDDSTGCILGEKAPKFNGWDYTRYCEEYYTNKELRFLEPMTAKELKEDKLQKYLDEKYTIGEQKFDGHRGLLFITSKGNRMFSRRVSKKTGWFAENSDQVPQIRDALIHSSYYGTVIDGEILLPTEDCSCRAVQSITGALPETAINNQLENGFAYLNAFDILYYKGVNVQRMPLWKRKIYLWDVIKSFQSDYIKTCPIFCTEDNKKFIEEKWDEYGADKGIYKLLTPVGDLEDKFRDFLKEEKEGLIIKDVEGIYEQKRTTAFVKMKKHLTFDVVIMGYEEPTREYTGKELGSWEYFDGETPVTKYYFNEWIGAIVFGVWKRRPLQSLINDYGDDYEMAIDQLLDEGKLKMLDNNYYELLEVGRTSGMDEETRRMFSEDRGGFLGTVIEVEAQDIINRETGSLQHPRFLQVRPDKNSEMCTFESHLK